MGDIHPLVVLIFSVLVALAVYSHLTAKETPAPQRLNRQQLKAQRHRSDPAWKDRGGC